jgi:hypothetical protein
MQLVWAENVVRSTGKPVLILTPLAVSKQTVREAKKFGIEAEVSRDGKSCQNITVTNYERLSKFNPEDYSGAVLDEASIVKHWTGATQKAATRFMSKMKYRLLCTATPSPNDYVEMGTLSEALGELSFTDMLGVFFRQISDDEKKRAATADDITHSRRLSWRVIQSIGKWVLKPHAFEPFWKWVASWARACRKPSDLGSFDDSAFVLPPLNRRDHTVTPRTAPEGYLFTVPAFGLNQERAERRRTLDERSELVAELVKDSDLAIVWCSLNQEGDALEKAIPGSVQIKGTDSNEFKEAAIEWFLGERCICGLKPKRGRAKLAKCGKNNTQKTDAESAKPIPSTPPESREDVVVPPKKTESTCEPTTRPTKTSTNALQSKMLSETPGGEKGTITTKITGKRSSKKLKPTEESILKPDSQTSCGSVDLLLPSTSECLPNRETLAQFVSEPIQKTKEVIDGTLTTATRQEEREESFAQTVIAALGTSETTRRGLSEQPCTCGHKTGRRVLVSKAKIIGLGMNLQCCAHVVTFVTHSWEQFRQCVGRCLRFGQQRMVTLDVIATIGEVNVRKNMDRKERLASQMFDAIVRFMNEATIVESNKDTVPVTLPSWLAQSKEKPK